MNHYFSLVKFSHTIFALPFAMLGLFLGFYASGIFLFDWVVLCQVLACMVFARSAAMAFNRYLDREIDRANPRTANREIPAGLISPQRALIFVVLNSALFVSVTFFINPLCFYLSPIALLVILGYSYTKRFTYLCHLILGLGLSLAPIGAYLAATGSFALLPILYSASVLCWVAGFDIIYAMQDEQFDEENNLYSIPSIFGGRRALMMSNVLHIICAVLILSAAYIAGEAIGELRWIHWLGAMLFVGLILYQHSLVRPGKLEKVGLAFFTTNGMASILFCSCFFLDLYI